MEEHQYLIGSVNFENTTDFQSIYASQLYGTFFGIYIKLNEIITGQDNFYIKNAEFRLLNYKGPINLGITQQVEFKKSHQGEYEQWPPGGVFKIEVQALHKKKSYKITTTKDTEYAFAKEGSYLCVDRRVKKMHPDPTHDDPNGIPLQNGVFDSEFYFRGRFERDSSKKNLTPTFIKRDQQPLTWDSPPPKIKEPINYPSEWCISGVNAII